MTRPIQKVVPLENVRVILHGVREANKVFTLVRPGTIQADKSNDGAMQFVVPRVDEYEVVVIEKEK